MSRSKKHRDRMLRSLGLLWERYPDMRLSQLLINVMSPREPCPEVFYQEDGNLIRKIERATKNGLGT